MVETAELSNTNKNLEQLKKENKLRGNFSTCLVNGLYQLGIQNAFGVSGGGIAHLYDGILQSPVNMSHFRHESGAAFAAVEAYFANQVPVIVFATTGPGIINALNGLMAAKMEGAKIIFLSGCTGASQRGRGATQETSHLTMPQSGIFSAGPFFDLALRLESVNELQTVMQQISVGMSQPQGFIAHLSIPMDLQGTSCAPINFKFSDCYAHPAVSDAVVEKCAEIISNNSLAIWVGFGARHASKEVRELVNRTGANVFCTPRAKGIVSEKHKQFIGVTGMGGHDEVYSFTRENKPDWILVLGSRLSEASSYWQKDMEPKKGFIHVDVDSKIIGVAFNNCYSMGIQSDIKTFLQSLLKTLPIKPAQQKRVSELAGKRANSNVTEWDEVVLSAEEPIKVSELMSAMQKFVIDKTDAIVMAECGNAFVWTTHYLRFDEPGRYRASTYYGSMGHAGAGVVGAAKVHHDKVFAVIGDGAMLMQNEVHTAVSYNIPAVWIILNDSGYRICEMGLEALQLRSDETLFSEVDFVKYAHSLGADGCTVTANTDFESALVSALNSSKPYIIDVKITESVEKSPIMRRIESIKAQMKKGKDTNIPAWGLKKEGGNNE
jgi:acetolactate synthase-1/2/3 large subunit